MTGEPAFRIATVADAAQLAELRWRWSPLAESAPGGHARFETQLSEWMRRMGDRSVCAVAVIDGRLVGMAWLAVVERVPNPGAPLRLSGDIQSMYVVPEHRGRGIGRSMLDLLLDAADRRGLQKVTADSSEAAVAFYLRRGFVRAETLLQRPRPASEIALGKLAEI